jgi:group I intron endonuclease
MMAFIERMKNWNKYIKDIFYNLDKERDLIKNKTLNKSGVYLWHNKVTDNYYVGSSINLYRRISRYFKSSYLNYVNHKNFSPTVQSTVGHPPIIRALQKYKMNNFILVILEYTPTNLHESEQYFIDLLRPAYNIMKVAGFRSGKKVKKEPISNEQKSRNGSASAPVTDSARGTLAGINFIKKKRSRTS